MAAFKHDSSIKRDNKSIEKTTPHTVSNLEDDAFRKSGYSSKALLGKRLIIHHLLTSSYPSVTGWMSREKNLHGNVCILIIIIYRRGRLHHHHHHNFGGV